MEQNKELLLKHLQLSFDDITKETFEAGLEIGKGEEFEIVNACLNAINEALNMHIVSCSCADKEAIAFGKGYNLGAKEAADEICSKI